MTYRITLSQIVGVVAFSCLLVSVAGFRCYECNVWKGGYGNLCENPRIRDGCVACMKVETTVFMGFYKNTPRTSTVISRTCALSKAVPYRTGCLHYKMVDGHSTRCYCDYEMCNGSTRQHTHLSVISSLASAAAVLVFKRFFSV